LVGLNLYVIAGNDPINEIDPLGLLTAIIIGGASPPSRGHPSGNPFGHASIAITGSGVYSFGTLTDAGSSLTDFLNRQAAYRDSVVYILDTTPEQEKVILDYLKSKLNKRLERYPDNCAHRTSEALKAAGVAPPGLTRMLYGDSFDLGENLNGNWPAAIGEALNEAGTLQIPVLRGTMLPTNFLTGFNPKR
jgi:hypothetical protein